MITPKVYDMGGVRRQGGRAGQRQGLRGTLTVWPGATRGLHVNNEVYRINTLLVTSLFMSCKVLSAENNDVWMRRNYLSFKEIGTNNIYDMYTTIM